MTLLRQSYKKIFGGTWNNTSTNNTKLLCLYAILTCNRASCFTRDITCHHHWCVSSWVMWVCMLRTTTSLLKQPFALFIFLQRFSPEWPITCSKITAVLLLCTDDDNRRYRNVCNMSFVSFAFATIFIIRLFSTSTFRVLNCYLFILLIDMLELCFMFNLLDYNFGCIL